VNRRTLALIAGVLLLALSPSSSSAQPTTWTSLGHFETILPLAERTATTDSAWYLNTNKSAYLILRVTAVTATPSITLTWRVWDPTSGATQGRQVVENSGAVTTANSYVYAAQRGGCSDSALSKCWTVPIPVGPVQFRVNHADADAITYALYFYGGN